LRLKAGNTHRVIAYVALLARDKRAAHMRNAQAAAQQVAVLRRLLDGAWRAAS